MPIRVCPISVVVFVATATFVTYKKRTHEQRVGRGLTSSGVNNVVFVLGAPGVGKGTQCQLLTERLPVNWVHLSAGDLLRAERSKDSKLADEINACIAAGKLVASEITCRLLYNAMQQSSSASHFLIDGFPRSQSNIDAWNATLSSEQYHVVAVLNYVCPEETLVGRLLERGKSSGRSDDNLAAVKARFATFTNETAPLLDYYKNQQTEIPVHTIATDKPVEAVYQETVQYFQ